MYDMLACQYMILGLREHKKFHVKYRLYNAYEEWYILHKHYFSGYLKSFLRFLCNDVEEGLFDLVALCDVDSWIAV